MLIKRTSPLTGEEHTRDIPCTEEQYNAWLMGRGHIQDIMPNVSVDDREFIMTGYTPEDWACLFPDTEDDDDEDENV